MTSDVRLQGTVAWAIAVPSGGAIQYRAGVEFVNPDKKQLTTYCEKHGGTPDPTTDRRDASARSSRRGSVSGFSMTCARVSTRSAQRRLVQQ